MKMVILKEIVLKNPQFWQPLGKKNDKSRTFAAAFSYPTQSEDY